MTPLLDATRIVQWADTRQAQGILPLLVGRLVLASVDPIRIDFASGDSVNRPGYDGFLQTADSSPCVPAGQSVWEMGTDKSPASKANGDYRTRTYDPSPVNPMETTFVFVTPRRWRDKDDWAADRRAEGVWRDVQALDAVDIEQWLDRHSAVAAWARRQVSDLPDGIRDLEDVWDGWFRRTSPPLAPEVFLAGRANEGDRVRAWLEGPPAILRVRADTADEAVGFIGAVVQTLDKPARDRVHARAAYVSTRDVWRAVAGNRSPTVLIAATADLGSEAQAVARGHHVAVTYGNESAGVAVDVVLSPLRRRELELALTRMGVCAELSERLATESRGRVAVLADLMGGGTKAPAWAAPALAPQLVPLLLAGSWGQNACDTEAVARLARTTPDELAARLSRWANETDPPVRLVGGMWEWVSRQRAWPHLARHVTANNLAAFRQVAMEVLGGIDTRLELPPDERWMAQVHDRSPRYSGALRKGLAETLALLASYPDGVRAGVDPEGLVCGVVRELFGDTPEPARWYSLVSVLPLLAEASPDAFLAAVERGPVADAEVRAALFQDEGLFGRSPHCHLLWALETLAWSAELLPRVAVVLAGLTANDPGGRTVNRPGNSLRTIFLPGRPYTTASVSQRLAAIDAINRCFPEVAFNLCNRLLPCGPYTTTPTPRPRWRPWAANFQEGVLRSDYLSCVNGLCERASSWAGADPGRWVALLTPPKNMPGDQNDRMLGRLESLTLEAWADHPEDQLRRVVRNILYERRKYEDIRPQLSDEHIARLEAVYARLTPTDPIRRDGWLFDQHPELLSVTGNDWRVEQDAVNREREAVVGQVLEAGRPDDLMRLAGCAGSPWAVGYAAGQSSLTDAAAVSHLAQCLGAEPGPLREYAAGLVWGRFRRDGWPWVERTFADAPVRDWPDAWKAAFATTLPFETATWDWVESWGEGVAAAYWQRRVEWVSDAHRDAPRAIRSFLTRGRPFAALRLASMCEAGGRHGGAVSAEQLLDVVRAVTAAATGEQKAGEGPPDWQGFGYDFGEILAAVERAGVADERELVRIEWAWLPVLERTPPGVTTLHRALARDPKFFAEVVGLIYRPRFSDREDEPAPPTDERTRERAGRAFRLLYDWPGVPGLLADGELDGDALRAWVCQARETLQQSGHEEVGDQEVGKVLARVPAGSDGVRPPPCVRELLEELQADEVDRGFFLGVVNGRGVTCRSPFDGGELERDLAARYERWAEATYAFPRTATVLRQLAESYRADARREDDRRDLNEFR